MTKIKIVAIVVFMAILTLFITLLCFFKTSSDYDIEKKVLDPNKFVNLLESEGCELNNLTRENNNSIDVNIYYETSDKSCFLESAYVITDDNESLNKLNNHYTTELIKNNSNIKVNKTSSIEGYSKQKVEGDYYAILLTNKVSLLYIKTDKKNKQKVIDLFSSIGRIGSLLE